jgi:hypothetical protein
LSELRRNCAEHKNMTFEKGDRVLFDTGVGKIRPGLVVYVDDLLQAPEIGVLLDHNGYTVYCTADKLTAEEGG